MIFVNTSQLAELQNASWLETCWELSVTFSLSLLFFLLDEGILEFITYFTIDTVLRTVFAGWEVKRLHQFWNLLTNTENSQRAIRPLLSNPGPP